MVDDREKLKAFLENYVESITEKSRNNRHNYVCPICGSGSGPKKDGGFSIMPDGQRWQCFACGETGDIFDLIRKVENVDTAEAFKRARDLFGGGEIQPKKARREEARPAQKTDFSSFIEQCQKALQTAQGAEALDYMKERGISPATIKRARIGFSVRDKRIVFPTDSRSSYYTTRTIGENKTYKKLPAELAGKQPLYNGLALYNQDKQPVFIVEGEFDALSIMEAEGQAVALLGAENGAKLIEAIKNRRPTAPVILSLDNDEAGSTGTAKIAAALDELGVYYLLANVAGSHKDPNEALKYDFERFLQTVREAEARATEGAANAAQEAAEQAQEAANEERAAYKAKQSARGYINQFVNDIANGAANTEYIPTGFDSLDRVLDGGLFEGLYFMGAISSLGKTTMAVQIADQIAASGHDVLIFSLEMARTEIMAKSISRESLGISYQRKGDSSLAKTTRGITTGKRYAQYSSEERETIKAAIQAYGAYSENIYIIEGMGDVGAAQIREAVEEHIRITGNRPFVLLDYLQLLAPHDPRSTDKQNTDKAVLELKRLSRDYKIPVLAISSLNRQNYNAPISMEAFKESGAIEYSSDVLIGLQARGAGAKDFDVNEAKRKDPREIELKILKNRNGRTGETLQFEYYPLFNLFKESGEKRVTMQRVSRR